VGVRVFGYQSQKFCDLSLSLFTEDVAFLYPSFEVVSQPTLKLISLYTRLNQSKLINDSDKPYTHLMTSLSLPPSLSLFTENVSFLYPSFEVVSQPTLKLISVYTRLNQSKLIYDSDKPYTHLMTSLSPSLSISIHRERFVFKSLVRSRFSTNSQTYFSIHTTKSI
jgi:hypothetical protein